MATEPQVLMGQRPFLWTGHNPSLPPFPSGLGSLPSFLASLLFWFNKTKPGNVACMEGWERWPGHTLDGGGEQWGVPKSPPLEPNSPQESLPCTSGPHLCPGRSPPGLYFSLGKLRSIRFLGVFSVVRGTAEAVIPHFKQTFNSNPPRTCSFSRLCGWCLVIVGVRTQWRSKK